MPPHEQDLTSAELEVLRTLWERGPATVRQVLEHLEVRGRQLAYTTVLTFLTRLEQKGFVRADKKNIAYVYRAKVSRRRVTKSRLRTLLEELYDGAAAPLVLQLMQEERFTRDELEQLQRLINELDAPESEQRPDRETPRRSRRGKGSR
jgi:predicted transcriptional regulator